MVGNRTQAAYNGRMQAAYIASEASALRGLNVIQVHTICHHCPSNAIHGIGQIKNDLSVCLYARQCVRPKYLSLSTATTVFVRSSSNLKCRLYIWQGRVSSMVSNTRSIKVNLLPVKLTFRLGSYGNIALMSNISKTVTDTTMRSTEAKYETNPGLSIGTMTFDLGWQWTVLVQRYQNYTSNISKTVIDMKLKSIDVE